MRTNAFLLVLLSAACLGSAGCWYQRPPVEDFYEDVEIGWEKDKVVEKLGRPTVIIENEMLYLYDDPENPVRIRFVLDDQGLVLEKYMETKDELERRMQEAATKVPPVQLAPGEEQRTYPGAPVDRFEKKPGQPGG
ncbi:MAG: hypothetical protein WBD63_09935 [Phycisphaerae bacterium]